jgi:biopolymer transport protein TolR
MGVKLGGEQSMQSEINIAPLVDVVLVLLIIFMVATPVLQMGLDVEVPPKIEVQEQQSAEAEQQVVVVVRDDGFYVNGERIESLQAPELTSLRASLTPLMSGRAEADRVVFINATDAVPFEQAVRAIDIAHASGALKIGFLTDPPQ